jgi:MFS family permease
LGRPREEDIARSARAPEEDGSSGDGVERATRPGGLHSYLAVLKRPDATPLVVASVLGRVPTGMVGLGWILLIREDFNSFTRAGMILAVFAVSSGVAVLVQGRLIDRIGQTPVLATCATGFPLALWLALLASRVSIFAAVVACAIVAGLTMPPLAASLRALFPHIVGGSPALLRTAYGLDTAIQESLYLLGPILVSSLAVSVGVWAPLLIAGGAGGLGAGWFATRPTSRGWQADKAQHADWRGPLRSRGIRVLVLATFVFGLAFGLLYLATPALAEDLRGPGAAGFALAAISAGTVAGSLLFGALRHQVKPERAFWSAYALLALLIGAAALSQSWWQLVVAMALVGVPEGPRAASASQLVERLSPPGTMTEAFTWLNAMTVGGSAAGLAVAGGLLGVLDATSVLIVSALVATVGSMFALVARRALSTKGDLMRSLPRSVAPRETTTQPEDPRT